VYQSKFNKQKIFSMANNQKKEMEQSTEIVKVTEDGSGPLLPHLESLERMMKLPMVEAAWSQGQGVYGKVRGM
jgi:perilipin-2